MVLNIIVLKVYKTYDGALKAWNKLRESYLEHAKSFVKNNKHNSKMWQRIVNNLSCNDPEKIDNYSHETPYIEKYYVKG